MTETKPSIDSSEVALRFDAGKVRYELIPSHLLKNTALVFGFGAKKYAAWNWAKPGMKYSTIIGCIKRHLAAIERGEDIDPESGLPHTGHLGCNLLMLEHVMELVKNNPEKYGEQDDRPTVWFDNARPPTSGPYDTTPEPTLLLEGFTTGGVTKI